MMAANIYLADHKATTIKVAVNAVKEFRQAHPAEPLGMKVLLASGNAGVLAATNEEIEARELPMMLYVYAAIMILVLLAYRDWRAMLACCVPLTVATFLGYWFMKTLDIGLTVATLPVMVLATGIGVDYAFYIYNRLLIHLSRGETMKVALEGALREVGIATIFTAITLSVGVATWAFSDLKFQADMGILLTFMFMINMVMAITVLPAFAVKLDSLFPRKGPVKAPAIGH
jgi:predicted RND superfamily exporter protein